MRIIKSDNMIGAAFMCGSMAGFALNDAAIKFAASEMTVYQAIFIRGVFTILVLGVFAQLTGTFRNIPKPADRKLIALRTIAEVGATMTFLTALVNMPIANITAILQALPLTVSIAAAIFMREYFGWRRAVAILIGFIGILIIVRPGADGFNVYALYGMAAVGFVTWRDLTVRRFSKDVSSLFVSFITAIVITIAGGIANVVLGEWTAVPNAELTRLALAAVFLSAGYYFSVAAMRVGEISSVAPFRYTIMIWAILLGWLVFEEIPDGWTILGMSIVVGMGVFTFYRERYLAVK